MQVLATDTPKYAQYEGKLFETSVGRLLFNSVLPTDHPFINDVVVQKTLFQIIIDIIDDRGAKPYQQLSTSLRNLVSSTLRNLELLGNRRCGRACRKTTIVEASRAEERAIIEHYEETFVT